MLCVILSGGRNTRYPEPKALIRIEGRSIIEGQLELVRSLGHEPLISTNSPELFEGLGVRMLPDTIKGAGPLGGIVSVFDSTEAQEALFMACDMPFVSRAIVEALVRAHGEGIDATVPLLEGRPEPLLAIYTRRATEHFRASIEQGQRSMRGALKGLTVKFLHKSDVAAREAFQRSFVNINTPDDFEKISGAMKTEE